MVIFEDTVDALLVNVVTILFRHFLRSILLSKLKMVTNSAATIQERLLITHLRYAILLHQYTTTLMNNESFTIDTEWKKHILEQTNFGELMSFRSKRLAICCQSFCIGDDIFPYQIYSMF